MLSLAPTPTAEIHDLDRWSPTAERFAAYLHEALALGGVAPDRLWDLDPHVFPDAQDFFAEVLLEPRSGRRSSDLRLLSHATQVLRAALDRDPYYGPVNFERAINLLASFQRLLPRTVTPGPFTAVEQRAIDALERFLSRFAEQAESACYTAAPPLPPHAVVAAQLHATAA